MIVQEQINNTLIRTYNDANVYIRGDNPIGNYAEAIDLISAGRVYENRYTYRGCGNRRRICRSRKNLYGIENYNEEKINALYR